MNLSSLRDDVPALDIDKELQIDVSKLKWMDRRIEETIVWSMIHSLAEAGWTVYGVDGGDYGIEKVTNAKSAMELVFNLDESWLYFVKKGEELKTLYDAECKALRQWVFLVTGNGEDILSDWSISVDSFDKAMQAFSEGLE